MSTELEGITAWFRGFATGSASPLYGRLSGEVADDPRVTGILLEAEPAQRLPMLLFAAVNLLRIRSGEPFPQTGAELSGFCSKHREELLEVVRTRSTQTNETNRCASLWPCFAAAADGRPIALIEVGASRGLNLNCDRYAYDYSGRAAGDADSPVTLRCELREGEPPLELPEIAWRAGIDLKPMPDDEWLWACAFADQPERAERLAGALEIAREHPVRVLEGDALNLLPGLIAEAPAECQTIVFHTAVRPYLPDGYAERLREATREATYVTGEHHGVDPGFRLEADGAFLGKAHVHGRWLEWGGDGDDRPAQAHSGRFV